MDASDPLNGRFEKAGSMVDAWRRGSPDVLCGVDLGGSHTRIAIADGDGRTLGTARASTDELSNAQGFVAWVSRTVRGIADGRPTAAIAVASPGPLDPKRGVILNPPNLQAWHNTPLTDMLSEELGCPAHLENDANLAAWGEYTAGAGRGTENMVYVTWSTGVGGGLVLDGRLFSGTHGTAGEIGHTIVDPNGPLDSCGQRGCVEAFCGGGALARQTGRPAVELFQAAADGDRTAIEIVRRAAVYMGYALINLVNLFDPEIIVMGGGITQSWAQVSSVLTGAIEGSPFIEEARRPRLCRAELGDHAGLVGALQWARTRLVGSQEQIVATQLGRRR